jgi:hypothetical protein
MDAEEFFKMMSMFYHMTHCHISGYSNSQLRRKLQGKFKDGSVPHPKTWHHTAKKLWIGLFLEKRKVK